MHVPACLDVGDHTNRCFQGAGGRIEMSKSKTTIYKNLPSLAGDKKSHNK